MSKTTRIEPKQLEMDQSSDFIYVGKEGLPDPIHQDKPQNMPEKNPLFQSQGWFDRPLDDLIDEEMALPASSVPHEQTQSIVENASQDKEPDSWYHQAVNKTVTKDANGKKGATSTKGHGKGGKHSNKNHEHKGGKKSGKNYDSYHEPRHRDHASSGHWVKVRLHERKVIKVLKSSAFPSAWMKISEVASSLNVPVHRVYQTLTVQDLNERAYVAMDTVTSEYLLKLKYYYIWNESGKVRTHTRAEDGMLPTYRLIEDIEDSSEF